MAAAAMCPLQDVLGRSVASPNRRGRGSLSVLGFSPPQRESPAKAAAGCLREEVHEEQPVTFQDSPDSKCASAACVCENPEDCAEETSSAETCREALQRLCALEEEVEELRLACRESGDAINSLVVDDDSEASNTCTYEAAESEETATEKGNNLDAAALLAQLDCEGCSDDDCADLFLRAQERLEGLESERARLLGSVAAVADAIARVVSMCREMDMHFVGVTD